MLTRNSMASDLTKHTLQSSRLETAPLAYDIPYNPFASSMFPDVRHYDARDTARNCYSGRDKDRSLDDHPSRPVGDLLDYSACYWPGDPSLAMTNVPHSQNGPSIPLEALYGLSTAQAPYLQSSQQETMQEEEGFNDDTSIFLMQVGSRDEYNLGEQEL